MKTMYKRILSLLLVISILFSTISVFAIENDDISINLTDISYAKHDVELPAELPRINLAEDDMLPTMSNISLYNLENIDKDEVNIKKPIIQMPTTDTVVIPNKRMSLDENGTSLSEIDDGLAPRSTLSLPSDSTYRIANINGKDSFALQNQTGRTNFIGDNIGQEYIDPMTGNLVVTETDLILPGVDGHDLTLSRYYSLAQAELYTKTAKISTDPKTYILPAGWYVVTEEIYNTETEQVDTCYYAYSDMDSANKKVREIETRDTCNGLYMYSASRDVSSEGDLITFDHYYTSEITSSSYQTIRNNLGAGWSWSFPSVQVVKDYYETTGEYKLPQGLYYHNGKGAVMEVDFDDPSDCCFNNYVGKDISFEIWGYYSLDICSSARIDYMVEDSDCTKYYFGPHGEIRSIIDIYGNKIKFDYTEEDFYGAEQWPVINAIIDSVGRIIYFTYTTDGEYDYVNVEVTSPVENEETIELTYQKKTIDVTYMDEYLSTESFLESVTYPNGEITTYYPANIDGERNYAQPIEFTFADKSFESDYVVNTSGYTNTLVYLLGNIVRPHSNTYYTYELCERNLGHSGISQAYRINKRGDDMLVVQEGDTEIIDGYTNNIVQYLYDGDYTGYPYYNFPDDINEDAYVCQVIEQGENATFKRWFYKKDEAVIAYEELATYNNPAGNPLKVTTIAEEYFMKMPKIIKKIYSNGSDYTYDLYQYLDFSTYLNKTYGKTLIETEELDYDTFHSGDRNKHGFSYTYDSQTGFMRSRSWYKSGNTKCTEIFDYDENERLSSYIAPDGTTTTYTYEYSGSNVSKKTTTMVNDTGTTEVVENYTSETAYAFPSTVVKTVTANDVTTTETTSYTYDMLYGVVKTMTDNEGNTTYYEYDELGRPTRIIYPVYSTYSAYGNKNIKILPIEDIAYETVLYEYSGVIDSDQRVYSQIITNDVTYYDVSNVDASNPTALELSTLPTTFYALKENYYLGTGELIRSDVWDIVEGTVTPNTTNYYYSTATNSVVEEDPQGNVTVAFYDGAGRKVWVTDQFDNDYITEYNISGDGVGFKALSYFVPNSDGNTMQNVIEYTYDRLGRTTKEKAYSEYPDEYVEVNYEYDFVGNVIGIIDANNNLNEDGYTQTNTYDKLNRVISSKNANNEIISNTYDSLGNIKKQTLTDSNGTESILYQRSYDGDGKLVSDTDNAGNSNLYVYDDMGRLHISQDKSSKQNRFGYNELGTLDSTSSANPGDSIIARNYAFKNPYGADVVYDVRGTYDETTGSYAAYVNEITQYIYSPTGNLTQQYGRYAIDTGIDGVSFNPYVHYQYDSTGNVISALYGIVDNVNETIWGSTTYYEYNKNRLSKVQIDGANTRNTAASVNVTYVYYDDGKLKSVTYPPLTDGLILKSEYVYDGLSRLTSLTNYKGTEVLSSYEYTYDNNGNILTTTENVGTTQNSVAYTYDKLNRIASVAGTKGADSYYEYDARGNRKANFEQIDFLSEESAIFIYDAEDMLDRSQVGDDITYFEYSSSGYRYFKHENSNYPEYYVYDPNGRLQAIAAAVNLSLDGTTLSVMYPITQYIWGPDRVLAKIDKTTNKSYYYLYNGHGDVVQIVDTSGAIKNTYDYDVWGNFLKKEETIENHFTYFGQTYDETTGLYYLRARYYDPTTGRFTQQDPAEDGYNWYVYGNQNPTKYIDSTGYWVSSDSKYSSTVQVMLLQLTVAWYMAPTDEQKNDIYNRANEIRKTFSSGFGLFLDKGKSITGAAADEFSWFLGGDVSGAERDYWLAEAQKYQSNIKIDDKTVLRSMMFVAGIISPSPDDAWRTISKKASKEMLETIGEKGAKKFINSIGKYAGSQGTNGIKKLKGSGIKGFMYEVKVKGVWGAYRLLGNKTESGEIFWEIFEKVH